MQKWEGILIGPEAPLLDAINIIDSAGGQIAIVADENRKLLGVITDADIRKAIVRNLGMQIPCSTIMTAMPIVSHETSSRSERLDIMRRRHIQQLPIVNDAGCVVDVALFMDMVTPDALPNPVVIMAGGLGSRLRPLTDAAPKPMLAVGNKPLLETILLQMIDQGFWKFFVSVNYKADMIMDYFGDGARWGVEIKYLHERERLGTAGALHLLPPDIAEDVIVINGDILTKVDLRRMLEVHQLSTARLTIGVKDYTMTVPYGVVQFDEHSVIQSFQEKPDYRVFVNAGIYVASPASLTYIPDGTYFDMPSLFSALSEDGQRMSAFPIREFWMDIGVHHDYERANLEYASYFTSEIV